ncbi:helix-turn-helix transcriptional regulator, partial [Enterococcus faecium]|nr:helix-turn-helix transcriptional regulator [Enterococcus faecium]
MKKLSQKRLAQIIIDSRKSLKMTQQQLAVATGINRALISRLESLDFIPSIQQLESLAEVLNFEPTDLFINESN